MGRKRKKKRPIELDKDLSLNVYLEDNAEELFLEALEQEFPEDAGVDSDEPKVDSRSPKSEAQTHTIDLHGLNLHEAEETLFNFIKLKMATSVQDQITLKIITGRGKHSKDGPVLADGIYRYVRKRFKERIVRIESAPVEASIDGLPVRGHFHVIMNRS